MLFLEKLILVLANSGVPVLVAIELLLKYVKGQDEMELLMLKKALIKELF